MTSTASEPNVIYMEDPVAVIGDIHGQFYDLVHTLKIITEFGRLKYLFLGDYVDRGPYSLEVMVVIMALKIFSPKNVVILRGNHETRQMASQHSFRQELINKKGNDQELFNAFMELFDCLPVAVVLNGKYFCVHGGLSPQILRVEDINRFDRKVEVPLAGPMCDLLWSDPIDREDGHVEEVWRTNKTRGVAYFFGIAATLPFLQANRLKTVLRAHECVFEGYKHFTWGQSEPVVSTIFSAPNYTDYYQNLASVLILDKDRMNYQQFFSSPHPFNLHRSQGLFDFTLTILSTKLIEITTHIYRRYYNEVKKEGSLTAHEIEDAMKQIKRLDEIEQNAAILEDSLLNDSLLVDNQGKPVLTKTNDPREKFFAARLYDQSNESAFGPTIRSAVQTQPYISNPVQSGIYVNPAPTTVPALQYRPDSLQHLPLPSSQPGLPQVSPTRNSHLPPASQPSQALTSPMRNGQVSSLQHFPPSRNQPDRPPTSPMRNSQVGSLQHLHLPRNQSGPPQTSSTRNSQMFSLNNIPARNIPGYFQGQPANPYQFGVQQPPPMQTSILK